jgi:DNA (cytosine-5)-methyltransferase 1
MASLTVGSLFSGIGGLDLGLERAGHRVIWHSEIDDYACRVLKKHWPDVPNIGDVKQVNWSEVPNVDIIAGGYPCQPFSHAGKRKGKEDPRHLWPYVLDAIRALRPRYALMENVRGHLTLGFGDVLADLASCGYSAEWQIIPASSVGAPHRRDRLFFVAYPDGERSHRTEIDAAEGGQSSFVDVAGRGETVAYSEVFGSHERGHLQDSGEARQWSTLQGETRGSGGGSGDVAYSDVHWSGWQRPLSNDREEVLGGQDYPRGENGSSVGIWWETEPDVGRVAHGVPARVDRLRGLGNAVVPQVAEIVGRLIAEHADN